jgi:hypothetical protein
VDPRIGLGAIEKSLAPVGYRIPAIEAVARRCSIELYLLRFLRGRKFIFMH